MTTLAVCNHKGGVGKTITAYWLAQHWATQGYTPLAIDLDPQGNLTRMFGGSIHHANGIADVLMRRTALAAAVQHCGNQVATVQLVGTDIKLEDAGAAIQAKAPNQNAIMLSLAPPPAPPDALPPTVDLQRRSPHSAIYRLDVLRPDPYHSAVQSPPLRQKIPRHCMRPICR